MQISDIESKRLLPSWAHGIDWIQAVFDFIVKTCSTRIPALDAPLTRQSIECLTNEELQEWFARFGVVDYYPELTRETRENMLYWLARLYRFLGTPQAVRILCEYIHDGGPLNVGVRDNLAWDGETLVDSSLLDMFDVEIEAESPQITPSLAYRIRKNILRIARNSQQLRNIIYQYVSWITVPVSSVQDIGAAIRVQNWDLARDAPVVLPTVTGMNVYNRSGGVMTIQPGASSDYLYTSTSDTTSYVPWDSTKTQCVYYWRNAGLTAFGYGALETLQYNGRVTVNNITSSNLTDVYRYRYAECSDSAATVVTVYNANNSSFNAFRFTVDGADYYYVLDGTQTDWTDNLADIGYSVTPSFVWRGYLNQNKIPVQVTASWEGNLYNESGQLIPYTAYRILRIINSLGNTISVPLYSVVFLNDGGLLRFKNNSGQVLYNALYVEFYKESIEVFFYFRTGRPVSSVSFSANDYWASVVIDETDKSALRAFGVDVTTISGSDVIGRNQQDTSLSFSPIGLYSGVREGDLQADMSNFYCADGPNNSGSVYYGLCIKSINAYATQSMTWKCRISRKS